MIGTDVMSNPEAPSGNGAVQPQQQQLQRGDPPVSVVILTYNEEANIAAALRSCAWCDDVHIVDSGSTDRTHAIARENGAQVHVHPFTSFGDQRNWAIDNIPHKHDWVFHLDADEEFTPELVAEMRAVIGGDPAEAGFYVPHKMMFMGRWLRYAEGSYPVYQMRLFHRARMRFCDYGHGQREDTTGRVGVLSRPYLHFNFSKGLEEWVEKHNRYSTLEALEAFASLSAARETSTYSPFGNKVQRRRYFKAHIYPRLPGKWIGRFLWMYVLRLGFLDGVPGLYYCLLVSTYDLFTTLKLAELKRQASGLEERSAPVIARPAPAAARVRQARVNGEAVPSQSNPSGATATTPSIPSALPSRSPFEKSPWTLRQKLGRVAWMLAQALLFRPSFHNWYGWRRGLLRAFGARIGAGVRVRPTVHVEIPWNLTIDDHVAIGDHAILYSLGTIHIGTRATISQYAHLCAGTHDYSQPTFPLLRPPIDIGAEAWVAADAFVGPGVCVGDRAIVGARATVVRDVPAGMIVGGNPARVLKARSGGGLRTDTDSP